MSTRRLLIDNDAFVLLAGAGLLEDAIARAGFLVKESRRLASLEFMLRKPAKAFQKYPAEVISRALEACPCSQIGRSTNRRCVGIFCQGCWRERW
jgi:hypothetical protein